MTKKLQIEKKDLINISIDKLRAYKHKRTGLVYVSVSDIEKKYWEFSGARTSRPIRDVFVKPVTFFIGSNHLELIQIDKAFFHVRENQRLVNLLKGLKEINRCKTGKEAKVKKEEVKVEIKKEEKKIIIIDDPRAKEARGISPVPLLLYLGYYPVYLQDVSKFLLKELLPKAYMFYAIRADKKVKEVVESEGIKYLDSYFERNLDCYDFFSTFDVQFQNLFMHFKIGPVHRRTVGVPVIVLSNVKELNDSFEFATTKGKQIII